jgi:hypothetical protein
MLHDTRLRSVVTYRTEGRGIKINNFPTASRIVSRQNQKNNNRGVFPKRGKGRTFG